MAKKIPSDIRQTGIFFLNAPRELKLRKKTGLRLLNVFLSFVESDVVDILLYALLLAAWADEQHIGRIDHDVILQSAYHGYLVARDGYHTTTCIVGVAVATRLGIGEGILLRELID